MARTTCPRITRHVARWMERDVSNPSVARCVAMYRRGHFKATLARTLRYAIATRHNGATMYAPKGD